MKLRDIQREVGEWSLRNFGRQETSRLETYFPYAAPVQDGWAYGLARLDSLAPLMGLVEEVGELFAARDDKDLEDALGDCLIYLCDYAAREKIDLAELLETSCVQQGDPQRLLVANVGRLMHVTLKRHQGIRGFADDSVYDQGKRDACRLVADVLLNGDWDFLPHGISGFDVLAETWELVKQRDWKADPEGKDA